MKKNTFFKSLFIVMAFCHSQTAFSAIFKCVNAQGKTYYNDRACPKNEKETQFRNIKDPKNGYVPPSLKAEHKAGSNNGVVVGSALERELNRNNKLDSGRSVKRSTTTSSGGTSGSTSSLTQNSSTSSTKQSVDSSNSNSTVSSLGGSIIPLRIEEVTIEPRDEVK